MEFGVMSLRETLSAHSRRFSVVTRNKGMTCRYDTPINTITDEVSTLTLKLQSQMKFKKDFNCIIYL